MLQRILRLSATAILKKPVKSVFSLPLNFLVIYANSKDWTMLQHRQLILSGMLFFCTIACLFSCQQAAEKQRARGKKNYIPNQTENPQVGFALSQRLSTLSLCRNTWTGAKKVLYPCEYLIKVHIHFWIVHTRNPLTLILSALGSKEVFWLRSNVKRQHVRNLHSRKLQNILVTDVLHTYAMTTYSSIKTSELTFRKL